LHLLVIAFYGLGIEQFGIKQGRITLEVGVGFVQFVVHIHKSLAAYNMLYLLETVDGLAFFCMVLGLVAYGLV
jgi:hypothetical protein